MSRDAFANASFASNLRSRSSTPPKFKPLKRKKSLDPNEETVKVDYHDKNLAMIAQMSKAKQEKLTQIEEDKARLERARIKLKEKVMQRMKDKEFAKQQHIAQNESESNISTQENWIVDEDEEEKLEAERQERIRKKQIQKMHRSRHEDFLKSIAEKKNAERLQEEKKQRKEARTKTKLAENLGYATVTSKLYEPTVTSMVNSNQSLDQVEQIKGSKIAETLAAHADPNLSHTNPHLRATPKNKVEQPELTEEEREKQKQAAREAAERIKQRAAEEIAKVALKKAEEERKRQEEAQKKEKMAQAARQKVLSMANTEPNARQKLVPDEPEPAEKPKMSRADAEAAAKRLTKVPKGKKPPPITDMDLWRKKHKLTPKDKVFIITGGYGTLRRSLVARGWTENKDYKSPCFDINWSLKVKDINFGDLTDNQIVNHFLKVNEITTKCGIARNLKNMIWYNNTDADLWFPRCYDVKDECDMGEFITDFKQTKAEGIVKTYIKQSKDGSVILSEDVVRIALDICERKAMDLDDIIDDPNANNFNEVSDVEWDLIASDEHLTDADLKRKRYEKFMAKNAANPPKKRKKRRTRRVKKGKQANDESASEEEEEEEDIINPLLNACLEIIERLQKINPQTDINGQSNAWILKPAGKSRGRGIICMNNLWEIIDHVSKESQFVIQKYIENPLIIMKKKFDIRQWILVTDFNPLTIWFFDRSYARFSVEDYDINQLSNRYIHLTNNSIVKFSDQFYASEIEGCMWHSEELEVYLQEQFGYDIWNEKALPKIKEIVVNSLKWVQETVENRKNSVELLGYDLMLDDECNPWLIEVNSSPAMDYSTPVTTELVKEVLEDCVKVMVDYRFASKKKRKTIDTGSFTLLHQSKQLIPRPQNSFGIQFMCQGTGIKKK